MNRFLAAFCGFGLGVLAGLVIAIVTQPTLRHVQGERAAAVERVAELEQQAAQCQARLTEARDLIREARESFIRSAEEHNQLRDAVGQLADNEFRSQAMLGLIIYHPEMRPLLTDPIIEENDRGWWAPEDSWKFFYGSDAAGVRTIQEAVERAAAARGTFRGVTCAVPGESFRSRLEMAKIGIKIIPEIEKAQKRKAAAQKDRAT